MLAGDVCVELSSGIVERRGTVESPRIHRAQEYTLDDPAPDRPPAPELLN